MGQSLVVVATIQVVHKVYVPTESWGLALPMVSLTLISQRCSKFLLTTM